jgi:transcription antitermination factor NusG
MLDIVSTGNRPTIVDEDLITNLRAWANDEVDIITLQPGLRVGDRVEIASGPMQGLAGTILKESEEGVRVTLLLTFLQSGAQVHVDRTDLRLIA